MKQFFPELDLHESLKKTREKAKKEKTPTVRTPRVKVLDCSVCKLDKGCKTPRMKGSGNLNSKVMIIGEAPGESEDQQGVPFIGRSGRYLRRMLNAVGVNDKEVYITNTCRCRPPDNQTPTSQQIQCCSKFLLEEINLIKPELIVLVGATPLEAMIGATEISKYHGFLIPSAKYNCILLPVFHPAAALRNEEAYTVCMREDLAKINTYAPISAYDLNTYIENHYILENEKDIELLFKEASHKKFAAIDIETNSLKPFNDNSRMLTFALAMNGEESYSFDITDNIPIPLIEKFFKSACIKLIHNAKFELMWFWHKFGLDIDASKIHDTMLFSYLIREVRGTHSLDFQAFARLGLHKMEEMKPYKNRMSECPPELLHKYNGLDTKLTYRLHEILYSRIRKEKHLFNFYKDVLIRAAKATLLSESQGAPVSLSRIEELSTEYENNIESIIKDIYSMPEVKKYKENNKFNLNSTPNVRDFLSEVYQITDVKQTGKKQSSVDKEVLKQFAPTNQFCNSMLLYRDVVKANSTYLKGMKKHIWDDGKIHTNFNLHVTETGRIGSDGPNLQNVDKHKHPELRSIFIPPKNHILMSFDYCLSGDTLLETVPNKMTIKEVLNKLNNNERVYVYSFDGEKICISEITNGRKTGINKEVWKVTLDNGKTICATPNHKFMLRDGTYKELQDLSKGESLMPFYSFKCKGGGTQTKYRKIFLNSNNKQRNYEWEHNLISKYIFRTQIKNSKFIIHHKDHNGLNNNFENLQIVTRAEHMSIHAKDGWKNKKEERLKKVNSKESQLKRQESLKRFWENASPEYKQMYGDMISHRLKGKFEGSKNPMFGREQTEETKKKISESKKGKKTGAIPWNKKFNKFNHAPTWEMAQKLKRYPSWNKGTGKPKKLPKTPASQLSKTRQKMTKGYFPIGEICTNHKITNIEFFGYEDVYNITVKGTHNYALEAGIIVKNCSTEVRGVSMLSKDEELKRIQLNNIDMHGYWAEKIFHVDKTHPDFAELYRYRAKNKFVFPLIYGSSVKSVAESLGISYEEADHHYKEFFKELSGLRNWQLNIKAFYMQHGYIETPFGRKRRAPLTHNQIINSPIQSIMSDFTLLSMIRLSEERDYWIMATIHDDLTFIIHENKIEEAYHDIRHIMTDYDYEWMNGIPLGVDCSVGPNWGEMKKFKL